MSFIFLRERERKREREGEREREKGKREKEREREREREGRTDRRVMTAFCWLAERVPFPAQRATGGPPGSQVSAVPVSGGGARRPPGTSRALRLPPARRLHRQNHAWYV